MGKTDELYPRIKFCRSWQENDCNVVDDVPALILPLSPIVLKIKSKRVGSDDLKSDLDLFCPSLC